MQHRKEQKAFTLVELLLVVTIIGILAGAVLINFSGQSERAKISRAVMDIQSLGTALSMYEIQMGAYPSSDQGLRALTEDTGEPGWTRQLSRKSFDDPWGNEYIYSYPGTHDNEYDLYSAGPDGQEGTDDDIGNWDSDTY
jgi:general secretion pathway protein G